MHLRTRAPSGVGVANRRAVMLRDVIVGDIDGGGLRLEACGLWLERNTPVVDRSFNRRDPAGRVSQYICTLHDIAAKNKRQY